MLIEEIAKHYGISGRTVYSRLAEQGLEAKDVHEFSSTTDCIFSKRRTGPEAFLNTKGKMTPAKYWRLRALEAEEKLKELARSMR